MLLVFTLFIGTIWGAVTIPYSKVGYALYPDWAHSHWVWLVAADDNAANVRAMLKGYQSRNISVGAVDLDSGWSTGFNNFIFDTKKFPNPAGLVKELHDQNIRVILWVTSMINTDSSNYHEGFQNNYYLNNGTTVKWWHGRGSFIDYSNVQAMEWWHKQMDLVLDIGVDGWKTDGTDPFVFELLGARGQGGDITEREYANAYYRDFFYYTRTKNKDSLIMSRPVDSYPPVYFSFSPNDVMFSGWVGDQDPTFDGLQDAMRNCFESAWAGYLNFGSDIGGYRVGSRTRSLFIRWFQWSTFMPLMENGGNGNHFPWQFDPSNSTATVDIYRRFVNIHLSLKLYFLTAGSIQYELGLSVITPLTEEVIIPYIHGWDYLLWRDFFIAPIVSDTFSRTVDFPAGNNWIDVLQPNQTFSGGTSVALNFPFERYPCYMAQGTVIAMQINDETSPFASRDESGFVANHLTAVVSPLPGSNASRVIRRWNQRGTEMRYDWPEGSKTLSFISTPSVDEPVIVTLLGVKDASRVKSIHSHVHDLQLPGSRSERFLNANYKGRLDRKAASQPAIQPSYYYQAEHQKIVIHCGAESITAGVSLDITFH